MCSTIKKNQRNFAVCDELAPASIRNLRQICMWLRVALIYRSGKGKTVRVFFFFFSSHQTRFHKKTLSFFFQKCARARIILSCKNLIFKIITHYKTHTHYPYIDTRTHRHTHTERHTHSKDVTEVKCCTVFTAFIIKLLLDL